MRAWLPLSFVAAVAACSTPSAPAPEAPAPEAPAPEAPAAAAPAGPAQASAPVAPARARPWEWQREACDLPVLPRLHTGALANGVRFAWLANHEPEKRCYLRLHVAAGSLDERDDERGMAHFVEHMAFNGTEHFKAGELIKWFQAHGMDFGADTNAFTSYEQTIYQIDLPESDAGSVSEGLLVLRDFAGGILFPPEEVQSEKGVIDSEERDSDSGFRRLFDRTIALLYDGTRIPEREPIGVKAVRDRFDAPMLHEFYRRWYRPENVTVVVVGDLGDLDPEALIRQRFADWAAKGEAGVEPPLGQPSMDHRAFAVFEAEVPYYLMGIHHLARAGAERDPTAAGLEAELPAQFARSMLSLRFSELAKKQDAAFLQASPDGVGTLEEASPFPPPYRGEELAIVATPARWEEALKQGETELKRALEHGFQAAELEEVRADVLRSLQEAEQREATRSSASWVAEILQAAQHRYVPMAAADRRRLLEPAVKALDAEACSEAFAEAWKRGELVVSGGGNQDLGEDGGQKLRAVYAEAAASEVEAPAAIQGGALTFESSREPAAITSRTARRRPGPGPRRARQRGRAHDQAHRLPRAPDPGARAPRRRASSRSSRRKPRWGWWPRACSTPAGSSRTPRTSCGGSRRAVRWAWGSAWTRTRSRSAARRPATTCGCSAS